MTRSRLFLLTPLAAGLLLVGCNTKDSTHHAAAAAPTSAGVESTAPTPAPSSVAPATPSASDALPSPTAATSSEPAPSSSAAQPPPSSGTPQPPSGGTPQPSPLALPRNTPAVTPAAADYANCAELNQVYPHGIGRAGAVDHTSGKPVTNFAVDSAVYSANSSHDADDDGIACEKH